MAEIKRYEGTIKWFNGQKGFGFIGPEDDTGDDLFVHQSEIKSEGFRFLRDGQRVEFSVESGEDGRKKAINVVGLGRTRGHHLGPRRGGRGRRSGEGDGMRGGRFGPSRGRGGDDGVGSPRCYNCGHFGHFARNCYQGRHHAGRDLGYDDGDGGGRGRGRDGGGGRRDVGGRGRGGQNGTCYHCGEEGHFARECPNDQDN